VPQTKELTAALPNLLVKPAMIFLELYTDLVFRYEPFGILPVFSYRRPKGNLVGKFGIIKLAGALYTHMVATHRRLLSARIDRNCDVLPLSLDDLLN
jgi:hypothetical protein